MTILAERLRLLREKRGLKQKAVAADINIGNTTLSNYEKGVSSPNPEILVLLADYFSTSADYLLGRTDDPSSDSYSMTDSDRRLVYIFNNLDDDSKKICSIMPRFSWRCRKTSGNEQTKSPLSAATDRKTPPCKGGVIFLHCFSHTNPSTFVGSFGVPAIISAGNFVG